MLLQPVGRALPALCTPRRMPLIDGRFDWRFAGDWSGGQCPPYGFASLFEL